MTQRGGGSRRRIALFVLMVCLIGAPAAQARYDSLGAGTTTITFDRSFLALLRDNGVKLEAVAPATLKGRAAKLPVVAGKFDPVADKGTVEHDGTLVLRAGRKRLPFRAFQLKTTQRRSPFSVKVGGGQLKLGRAAGLGVQRSGFGSTITVADLTLASKVATRLGKKLGLRRTFREGLPIGRSRTTTRPATVSVLERNRASLVFAPGFVAKLDSLFVAVNSIFPAEHPAGPEYTIPLLGGTLAPAGDLGTVELSGALEFLQQGGGQAFWRDPWVELGPRTLTAEVELQPSPPFAGKVGRLTVAPVVLSPSTADSVPRTIGVGGSLNLDAGMAAMFNELFAKPQGKADVFSAGEPMASISFTAQAQ